MKKRKKYKIRNDRGGFIIKGYLGLILLFITTILLLGSVVAGDSTTKTTTTSKIANSIDTTDNSISTTDNAKTKVKSKSSSNTNTNTQTKKQLLNSSLTKKTATKSSSPYKTNTYARVSDITGETGETVTLKATITSTSGYYVTKGKTVFKINGRTLGMSSTSNGVSTYRYTIPSNWKAKTYKINVVYGENSLYNPTRADGNLKVVHKQTTYSSLSPTSAKAGKSITFVSHLTSSSGSTVNSGNAVFKINDKTIGSTKVSGGYARVTMTIPSNWKGKYKLTFKYSGNDVFKSNSKSVTFKVKKKTKKKKTPKKYASYTKSTNNCQVKSSTIRKLAKRLTKGAKTKKGQAKRIFNYVKNQVTYSSYFNTMYGAVGTYLRGYGNCVDQSHLLIALLRSKKIPARYNHATCYFRSGLVVGHVWAQAYVNGKWYKLDPTSRYNSFGKIVNWHGHTSIVKYKSLPF